MEQVKNRIVLNARGLYKSFYNPLKVSILKGVDLQVAQGETIAIMGRSGEGKSTLLQILGTLEPPCKGTLEITGETVSLFNKTKIRNESIAFVFQSFYLLEDCTALENVLLPARIARKNTKPGTVHYGRGVELLEKVGLGKRMHFNTKLLSGGEKQRVAIARALCNDPDLLLADEPSGNLDKKTASSIHELLLEFVSQKNKSLIVVTHDPDLANLCKRHYVLEGGVLKN